MPPGLLGSEPNDPPSSTARIGLAWAVALLGVVLLGLGLGTLSLAAYLGMDLLTESQTPETVDIPAATQVMIVLPYAGPDPSQLPAPSQNLPTAAGLTDLVAEDLPDGTRPEGLRMEPAIVPNRLGDSPTAPSLNPSDPQSGEGEALSAAETGTAETGAAGAEAPIGGPFASTARDVDPAERQIALAIHEEITQRLAEIDAAQAGSPAPVSYRDLFEQVGGLYGIDWRILAALAYRESRLDPSALGADGDMGLMQIIPSTWAEFAPATIADSPFDPYANADVAARYLFYLQTYLTRLGHGELYWVLVAYNWGPSNVRQLLGSGGDWHDVPGPQQQYVADILEMAFDVK